MNLKKLRQVRHDLVQEAKAMLEAASASDDGMTDEDQAKYDAVKARIEKQDKLIAEAEQLRDDELAAVTRPNINEDTEDEIEAEKTPSIQVGEDTSKRFKSFGEFIGAVVQAGDPNTSMQDRDSRLNYQAVAGASEGIASDGGFLVQQDFASELLSKAYGVGEILPRVRKVPISPNANGLSLNVVDETSRATGSRFGGVQMYWKGEGEAPTAKKPKFRQMDLKLKKLIGLMYSTDELLQDSVAFSSIAEQAFSEELNFMIEESIIEGTGAGQPKGIKNAGCMVTQAKESGQAADTVVYANVLKMWSRLWARSRGNAVWLINQDVEPQLGQMSVDGSGNSPVYLPPGQTAANSPYGTLFGRPVVPIEHAETVGDLGDITLADFSQYLMIDKGQPKQDYSIHVRFIYDEQAFRIVYRADGQPIWNSALTPKKGSNTVSPFVNLAARA